MPPDTIGSAFWTDAFGRTAPLVVEVGFGNGAALAELAKTHPDWNCVGVDVYRPGFGALMLACDRDGIDNVRIADTEARCFLHRLEPGCLHRLLVFFPDPWPKKRHHKRRLVDADFATVAAQRLEVDGAFALATDWPPYAEQMQAVLDAEPDLQGGPAARAMRPVTPFEVKGLAGGRPVVDLEYRRTPTGIAPRRR